MKGMRGIIALSASALLLLAGCSAPDVSGSPAPTETTAVTPTPAAETAELVLGPDGFVVLDSSGEAELEFAWADDPATIVADLERIFGSAPETSFWEGDASHYKPVDFYDWGGFSLGISRVEGARADYFLPAVATLKATDIDGIQLRARAGVAVGSPLDDLLHLSPPPFEYSNPGAASVGYYVDPRDPSADLSDLDQYVQGVLVSVDPSTQTVVSITAPRSPNDP